MAAQDATPKPALVAILAIVILAVVAVSGVYLLMGPLPDGFERPALTDVLAITASVIAPIVSIAAAYYGITIALKATTESAELTRRATETSLQAAENFTTAITNITIDLHNQNVQLIETLQRGGTFADVSSTTDVAPSAARSVPTATGAIHVVPTTGPNSTVDTPQPTPAGQHANADDIGLGQDRPQTAS
ncbi:MULTISPECIES: hypothetical protein [unclassified Leifsonia]|uniref:hypothetical protein n=1 Tax=unclassified Leifsonia TaxID=2663824 RepID=UPI0006FE22D3|nr:MULTISPECIES: hypothetical protein [unclassified Leifsonia]KQX05376.1 hypothetical protein ASC59_14635 [Leifsonia sp. Root1293]KRA09009.1 hypothetical protein ASD61_14630 [Leifsonia sp. Root60]